MAQTGGARGSGAARLWFHGATFCIALAPDEVIERQEPVSDFTLYEYRRGDTGATIYEGAYPGPGGIILRTGADYPPLLSVHGPRALARRILTGNRRSACP